VKRVAIVGAGITGLSAMHYLLKEGSGMTVDLYEASDRAGGKVNTHIRDGYTIELGPESYLARKEVMTELAYEVGLGDTLVRNQTGQAYIYAKNKLSPVPKGTMLGVPMELSPLLTTDLVSWTGKLRAGLDFLKPAMPLYKDISVGEFFRARFGDDLLEHMIEPLLAGVYGTDIDKLSLMSTYPNFKETEEEYGSLMKGLMAEKKDKAAAPKKKTGAFLQFKDGLQSFIDRLVSENENAAARFTLISMSLRLKKLKTATTLQLTAARIITMKSSSRHRTSSTSAGLKIKNLSTSSIWKQRVLQQL
jgi:protoporphyrinogen oxidase